MLEAHGICVDVPGKRLLDDVSMRINAGKVVALVGPNGAGKSSLLKALSGEMKCSAGHVTLDGAHISSLSAQMLAARRAVVPQAAHLAFQFSVLEVVMLGASVPGFGSSEPAALECALQALALTGLAGFEARQYAPLSGGEKQRVHIARALCQLDVAAKFQPGTLALLLDEPTSSLDLAHQALVANELREQAEAGRAVLVVMHDLNLAAAIADEIVLLAHGKIVARGSAETVYDPALIEKVYGCRIADPYGNGQRIPLILPCAGRHQTIREAAQ